VIDILSSVTPFRIDTGSALPAITFYRSDLANSVTVTHTSADLLTFSSAITANRFNGSGAGLTGIPISAISATGTPSASTYLRGDGTWGTPSGSGVFDNPMTSLGDLIVGDTGGGPLRLAAGADGQVLGMTAGVPTWTSPTAGGGVSKSFVIAMAIALG
jgi:hypothetical protein